MILIKQLELQMRSKEIHLQLGLSRLAIRNNNLNFEAEGRSKLEDVPMGVVAPLNVATSTGDI